MNNVLASSVGQRVSRALARRLRQRQTARAAFIIGADTMPDAVPARMFLSTVSYNSQTELRRRTVTIRALLDDPRYTIADPRDPPRAPLKQPTSPKLPPPSSGKMGRPRGRVHVEHHERDALVERLLAAKNINDPI